MAYRIIIIYGQPQDPKAFDEYFKTKHWELAKRIPNVRHASVGKLEAPDGSTPEGYLVAQYTFPAREQAVFALASPEAQAATDDFANFATGGVKFFFSDDEMDLDF